MFVITGCQVMDGDAYCWVVDVVNEEHEADAAVDRAEIKWDLDYGKSHEDSGVEFKISRIDGVVQR